MAEKPPKHIDLYRGQPFFSKILPKKGTAGHWFTPIPEKADFYRKLFSGPLSGKIVKIKKEPISNWKKAVHRAELFNHYGGINSRLAYPEIIKKWERYPGPLSKAMLNYQIEGKLNPAQAYKKIDAIFDDYHKGRINIDELKGLLPEGLFSSTSGPSQGKAKTAWGKTLKPMIKPLASMGAKALGPLSFLMADPAYGDSMEDYGKHQHPSKYVPNVLTYPME